MGLPTDTASVPEESISEKNEDEDEDIVCVHWLGGDAFDGNGILICEGAHSATVGWHQLCVTFPLREIPTCCWLCPECVSAQVGPGNCLADPKYAPSTVASSSSSSSSSTSASTADSSSNSNSSSSSDSNSDSDRNTVMSLTLNVTLLATLSLTSSCGSNGRPCWFWFWFWFTRAISRQGCFGLGGPKSHPNRSSPSARRLRALRVGAGVCCGVLPVWVWCAVAPGARLWVRGRFFRVGGGGCSRALRPGRPCWGATYM